MKRISVGVLTAVMLLLQLAMPAFAASNQTLTFSSEDVTASKGDTVILPITISSESVIEISGLALSIKYKTECLAYKKGSFETSVVSGMSDCVVYNDPTKGVVTFAWTSVENVKLSKKVVVFKPQFEILQSATVDSSAVIEITEAYTYKETEKNPIVDFNISNKKVDVEITIGTDSSVKNVMDLIDSIGKVEYTQDSLNEIMAAASAYSMLTEAQKQKVTNYNVLSEAIVEYERLRIASEESKVSQEISEYMEEHIYALGLTIDTVTIEDEEAVTRALDAYGELSADAKSRSEVYKYKKNLDKLQEQIGALIQEKKDAEKEAEYKVKAKEYADSFKDEYKALFQLTADTVTLDHEASLNKALSALNMLSGLQFYGPYVEEYLKGEKILLTALIDTVQDMKKDASTGNETTPEIEADNFRNTFAYILSLQPDDVTADDALEIRLAEALYDMLDPAVQELLVEECAHIGELLSALDNLPEEDEQDDNDNEESVESVTEKNVIVKNGLEGLVMRFANRQVGIIVAMLLLLLLLSTIIFVVLQLFYHFYMKKGYKSDGKNMEKQRKETIYDSSK